MDMLIIVYMRYKLLGKSGLRVSGAMSGRYDIWRGLGLYATWSFKEEAKKIFDIFVIKAAEFIDTANVYQMGTSEKVHWRTHFFRKRKICFSNKIYANYKYKRS